MALLLGAPLEFRKYCSVLVRLEWSQYWNVSVPVCFWAYTAFSVLHSESYTGLVLPRETETQQKKEEVERTQPNVAGTTHR